MVELIVFTSLVAISAFSMAFGTSVLILDRSRRREVLNRRTGKRLQQLQSLAADYSERMRLLEVMLSECFLSTTSNTHRSLINMRRMLNSVEDHLDQMASLREQNTLRSLTLLDKILRKVVEAPNSTAGTGLSLARLEAELEQNAMIIAEELYRIKLENKGGYLASRYQAATLDEYLDLLGVELEASAADEPPSFKFAKAG